MIVPDEADPRRGNGAWRWAWAPAVASLMCGALLVACTRESRTIGPEQPQTPPNGANDPRIANFEGNAYQIAQGGRYFTWYGCGTCHTEGAPGRRDLALEMTRRSRSFDTVYALIAGHRGVPVDYAARIPIEQLWQISAYVRSLPGIKPELRRRQTLDQTGEPQASNWSGPVR